MEILKEIMLYNKHHTDTDTSEEYVSLAVDNHMNINGIDDYFQQNKKCRNNSDNNSDKENTKFYRKMIKQRQEFLKVEKNAEETFPSLNKNLYQALFKEQNANERIKTKKEHRERNLQLQQEQQQQQLQSSSKTVAKPPKNGSNSGSKSSSNSSNKDARNKMSRIFFMYNCIQVDDKDLHNSDSSDSDFHCNYTSSEETKDAILDGDANGIGYFTSSPNNNKLCTIM